MVAPPRRGRGAARRGLGPACMAQTPVRLPFHWSAIDPAVRREIVYHHAADGVPLSGILYLPPSREPGTAVLAMHPRGDFTRHYLAPKLAAAGYAFLGTTTRYLNNDADALHERLLLDVAGTIAFLRGRGFSTVVLLGNSGGGSLFAFYLEQAAKPRAERLARAPSGDRVPLGDVDLPAADGLILLAAHLGEGQYLLDHLDPSVIDEGDPTAADPRRPAAPGPVARPVRAPPRIDLLLRPRPGRRQLRRGAGTRDERAWLAVHLVGAPVERRARAHAACRDRADAGDLRHGGHRHLSERVSPGLRGGGRPRQDLRGAARRRPLPQPRRGRGRPAPRPARSRRRRADRPVAPPALEDLTSISALRSCGGCRDGRSVPRSACTRAISRRRSSSACGRGGST